VTTPSTWRRHSSSGERRPSSGALPWDRTDERLASLPAARWLERTLPDIAPDCAWTRSRPCCDAPWPAPGRQCCLCLPGRKNAVSCASPTSFLA
jgi:hypothetical protein